MFTSLCFNADVNEGMGASRHYYFFSRYAAPHHPCASMDVLSSQANIAGYKAVLTGCQFIWKIFSHVYDCSRKYCSCQSFDSWGRCCRLQAIATARRLGAVVEVFDTRPAVKEEVMSLGAKFVEVEGAADASKAGGYAVEQIEEFLQRQKARIAESIAKADIVITTAQIPGKKAPILITEEMIKAMRNGSVIIDLAAATGVIHHLQKIMKQYCIME